MRELRKRRGSRSSVNSFVKSVRRTTKALLLKSSNILTLYSVHGCPLPCRSPRLSARRSASTTSLCRSNPSPSATLFRSDPEKEADNFLRGLGS